MKRKSLNAQKINYNFISNLLNKDFIKPIFSKFEKKLNSRESFLVAVSGGPDSLALAFLSKCYEEKYGAKFNYCIISPDFQINFLIIFDENLRYVFI